MRTTILSTRQPTPKAAPKAGAAPHDLAIDLVASCLLRVSVLRAEMVPGYA